MNGEWTGGAKEEFARRAEVLSLSGFARPTEIVQSVLMSHSDSVVEDRGQALSAEMDQKISERMK